MTSREPGLLFAPIVQGAAGQSTIVAAVAGKKIVVVNYTFTMSAAGSAKLQSNNTDLTGAMPIAANGGVSPAAGKDSALMETAPGEALKITTVTGLAQGHVAYRLSDV